jgi:Na+-driven multidrug efflux pump
VLAHARSYLRWAGPGFAFFGLGLTLYFAAQGAGKVAAPVAASLLRFLFVLLAGHALAAAVPQPWALFALVGAAMALYGVATALGVRYSTWQPQARAVAPAAGLSRPS